MLQVALCICNKQPWSATTDAIGSNFILDSILFFSKLQFHNIWFKFSWSLRAFKMWKYRRSFVCDFKKCYGPIVTDQTQWKMRFFECHHLSKYVVDHRFRVNGGRFKNSSWNIFLGDVFISLGNSIKIMTRSLLVASFKIFSFSSLKKAILIVFYDSNMSSLIYFLMHVHIRPKAMAAYIGGVEDTCKVFPSAGAMG